MKSFRNRIEVESMIKRLNDIRDRENKEGFYYPWILRFIAGIYSKKYTKVWERWYD